MRDNGQSGGGLNGGFTVCKSKPVFISGETKIENSLENGVRINPVFISGVKGRIHNSIVEIQFQNL